MATKPPVEDQLTTLLDQQDAYRQKTVAAAVALVLARTRGFSQWYSTAAITAWALGLARDVEVVQRNLARQTDAFLARQATLISGRTVRPAGVVSVANLRQGITHAGAYGRIADVYRYQQSRLDAGALVESALDAALERAEAIAEMDTQLAVRAQSQHFMEAQPAVQQDVTEDGPQPTSDAPDGRPRLIGYRRMVHPELSKGGSCGMCIVASTRLYYVDNLMPIHAHCNCLPLPVYEGGDPGGLINESELARFYQEAGSNRRDDLKKTRYQVDEHGELGPVLNRRGAAFRTPGDVARDEER